jgi:hypothetical protein
MFSRRSGSNTDVLPIRSSRANIRGEYRDIQQRPT